MVDNRDDIKNLSLKNTTRLEMLESTLDRLCGEHFFERFMEFCNAYVAFEAKYLGEVKDLAYLKRLERFRKEELLDSFVCSIMLYAQREELPVRKVAQSYLPMFKWDSDSIKAHVEKRYGEK